MVNFSLLPPEVNSGLMYSAPGSDELGTAASEWDCFAAELYSTALSYDAVIAQLFANWPGPSAMWIAGATAYYASGVTLMAARAARVGTEMRAAQKSFQTVFAMTVPPMVIAANRAWLTTLAATNLLGQNTQAIATTEIHYLEMWAQDAVALNGHITAFHHEIKTARSSKPVTAPLGPASTTLTGTAAYDAAFSAIATSPIEMRWALSSLMMPGRLSDTVDSPASRRALPSGTQAAGTTDAASAAERLAMYPVSMLAQAAQVGQTGAPGLTVTSNGLLRGFGHPVGRAAELVVEGLTEQAHVWLANVSARVAQAMTLRALSIPPAWLTAAPELCRTREPSHALNDGSPTSHRAFEGAGLGPHRVHMPAEVIPGRTGHGMPTKPQL